MKSAIACIISAVASIQLESNGIPNAAIMQNQIPHWRKIWPQGDTDDSNEDDKVIDMFLNPPANDNVKPPITYPWAYDEDVIATKNSLAEGEKMVGTQFTAAAAKERSMDMIDSYDNNRRVWERNMPYGNQWGVSEVTGRAAKAPKA